MAESNVNNLGAAIENNDVSQTLMKILCICLNTNSQLADCIISSSGIQNFDQLLNEIKTIILKIFYDLTTFAISKKGKPVYAELIQFNGTIETVLRLNLSTILKFCQCENFDLTKVLMVKFYDVQIIVNLL